MCHERIWHWCHQLCCGQGSRKHASRCQRHIHSQRWSQHILNKDNQAACTRKTCFRGEACDCGSASAGTVHKGWLGPKASFPFPCCGTVRRHLHAEGDSALPWALTILSRLSCPPGTAWGQTALPTCPDTPDPQPGAAIHQQLDSAAAQCCPGNGPCQPGTNSSTDWLLFGF